MSRVDVIIPCYGYGAFLEGCVRSVLSQEGVEVRILILDDCSPDNTPEVAARLQSEDGRIEYRRHARNVGNIGTYNEGLAWVTGDYVLLISADDLLTPGALARAATLMDRHPEVGFVFGPDIVFETGESPVATPEQLDSSRHSIVDYPAFLETTCRLGHTPIQAPCIVVRSSTHRAIGDYLPELPQTGDTELWLRLAATSAAGILQSCQAFRRVHRRSMSFQYTAPQRILEQKKAFDVHFAWRGDRLPDAGRHTKLLTETLAEKALCSASISMDRGDGREASEFLALALTIRPELRFSRRLMGLRIKRLMGRKLWSWAEHLRKPLRAGTGGRSATAHKQF